MCFEFVSSEDIGKNCVLCKFHGSKDKDKDSSKDFKCPHVPDMRVCQNRQTHPQLSIVHFTNSEFAILNGCGYCRWLKRNPNPSERDKVTNQGWPGCCRCPIIKEWELIDEKDWPIVSFRFAIANPYTLARERARLPNPASKDPAPRRLQAVTIPSRRSSIDSRDDHRSSPSPHRRGSPHLPQPSTKDSPRLRDREDINGTPPSTRSSIEQHHRSLSNGTSSTRPSSSQQSVTTSYVVAEERNGGMYHTRPIPRPNVVSVPGSSHIIQQPSRSNTLKRSAANELAASSSSSSSSSASSTWSSGSSISGSEKLKLSDISKEFEGMSLSSTSSNRDSMTTVMSDGAFTDYLSDESEAELQRQAEERAAQLRKLRLEEAEFNAAKRGLAHIDVGTPIQWNPTRPQPYDPSAYARR